MVAKPVKKYGYTRAAVDVPPNYERVVQPMSKSELREELARGRGDAGYQEAVRAELERRQ